MDDAQKRTPEKEEEIQKGAILEGKEEAKGVRPEAFRGALILFGLVCAALAALAVVVGLWGLALRCWP